MRQSKNENSSQIISIQYFLEEEVVENMRIFLALRKIIEKLSAEINWN